MTRQIITVIFFIAFSIYAVLGIYSLLFNKKELKNRLFFVMCISFMLWSFSFANLYMTSDPYMVGLWRRVAAIGWGTVFSIILHLSISMSGSRNTRNNWVTLTLIYLPALVNVLIYSVFSSDMGKINSLSGGAEFWLVLPADSLWDVFYNAYYITFSVLALIFTKYWKNSRSRVIDVYLKKIIVVSFIASVLLGTITDTILKRVDMLDVPSLACVFSVIPVIAIFMVMKKTGWLDYEDENEGKMGIFILGSDMRLNFIRYISYIVLLGSYINLLHLYLAPDKSYKIIMFSGILVFVSILIMFIPFITSSREKQDLFIGTIFALVSTLAIVRFDEPYSNNVIWPVGIVFMFTTILFDNKKMLLFIGATNIAGILISRLGFADYYVNISIVESITKLSIYTMAFIMAVFINRVFSQRIMENNKQVDFQRMIYNISSEFINVSESNFKERLSKITEVVGNYYSPSCVCCIFFDTMDKQITDIYCCNGSEYLNLSKNLFSELILENKTVYLSLVNRETVTIINSDIFDEQNYGRINDGAETRRIKFDLAEYQDNFVATPLVINNYVRGAIIVGNVKAEGKTFKVFLEHIKLISNIISSAVERINSQNKKKRLAFYDYLTELPNRRSFNEYLKNTIEVKRERSEPLGVILVDLDGFKEVNDSMGHEQGDYVIKEVADRLVEIVGEEGMVARFGGDEFLMVVDNIRNHSDVERVAESIINNFKEPIRLNEQEFFVTVSCGIAHYPIDGENVDEMVKNADLAMYAAKQNGKNQYASCTIDMKVDILNKMKLTNGLFRAIQNGELSIQYQPQFRMSDDDLAGFEAFLRWENHVFGRIDTLKFIRLAEESGLISSIGNWVLMNACIQNKKWQDIGMKPVRVAVNISVNQFHSGDFINSVTGALRESGLHPDFLELEITESIIMRNPEYVVKTLAELKRIGVKVAIDDFGKEYSSLSKLKQIQADRLKIDMVFTKGIDYNKKDRAIIEVITRLTKDLELDVVAEGVETKGQYDFLKDLGCEYYQGFYKHRPMSADDIEKIFIQ